MLLCPSVELTVSIGTSFDRNTVVAAVWRLWCHVRCFVIPQHVFHTGRSCNEGQGKSFSSHIACGIFLFFEADSIGGYSISHLSSGGWCFSTHGCQSMYGYFPLANCAYLRTTPSWMHGTDAGHGKAPVWRFLICRPSAYGFPLSWETLFSFSLSWFHIHGTGRVSAIIVTNRHT